MSETLEAIIRQWTSPFPPDDKSNPIEFPFNVERFCRVMDERLATLEQRGYERGIREAARIAYANTYANPGYINVVGESIEREILALLPKGKT